MTHKPTNKSSLSILAGVNPLKTKGFIKGLKFYVEDLKELKRQQGNNTDFVFGKAFPILKEKFEEAGNMNGAYFHQDLLVARRIYQNSPQKHVDIGSRVDGFVAHIAVFREIELFDIRPLNSSVKNIRFKQADLINLPKGLTDYCDSLSTLHAIEHFGLGRYGDPIDYYGHIKALDNIYKILKTGGKFYFSTPIGEQRIEFNAHRVFSVQYLLDLFKGKYRIDHFSYIDDKGDLHENTELTPEGIKKNFNCHYGCGVFEMTKL